MMNRREAIKWIKRIQSGSGVARYSINVPRDIMAKELWDDTTFTYGIEYGVIIALMETFDINKKDLVDFIPRPKPPKSKVLAEKNGG